MADLTITAASVVAGSGASRISGTLGETVTAGQPVVKNPTTKKYVKTDSNHATAALRVADGIALNGGAVDQPVSIATHGPVTMGATLVAGTVYAVSETAGGIQPVADLASGETVCILGVAASASVLNLDIQAPGVTL